MSGEIGSACGTVQTECRCLFTALEVTVESQGIGGRVSLLKIDEKLEAKEKQRRRVVRDCVFV